MIRFPNREDKQIKNWNCILKETAEYLIDLNLLATAVDNLVKTEPRNSRTDEPWREDHTDKLSNGLFYNTGWTKENVIKHSKYLLRHFDKDPSQIFLKS